MRLISEPLVVPPVVAPAFARERGEHGKQRGVSGQVYHLVLCGHARLRVLPPRSMRKHVKRAAPSELIPYVTSWGIVSSMAQPRACRPATELARRCQT